MNLPVSQIPSSVTFEQAMELTQSLLDQIELGQISEQQVQNFVTELVKNTYGARGFFVIYLTDQRSLPASFFKAIIAALKSSPKIVSELQTKNLAMSTATAIFYERNNDREKVQKSRYAQQLIIKITRALQLPELDQQLQYLYQTLVNNQGSYQQFLERYNYDSQQKQEIQQVIAKLIAR